MGDQERREGGPPPEARQDLDVALASAWQMIVRAVKDRHTSFHTPTLATIDPDGAPSARTVVLRGADADNWTVRFNTDWRAPKAHQMTADERVMFHFYDRVHKVQVRATGTAQLHHQNAFAEDAWEASAKSSQQCYFAQPGPGTVSDEPTSGLPEDGIMIDDRARGLEAFTTVVISVSKLDWLFLDHRGHRRASFERVDGQVRAQWLVP